ncbi:glycosyltransferase family 4 protein [Sphingomonas glacialis]|uniref:Glycosyltransferase family 1 protein n=1 Tax=Sphingomonas glacialis TaxID=658225 RepID=A0A502FR61_9SPHN|nr:glycosyltransferase family 1 protein [Sphingomonas glacialis]TPG51636.1 glycosyltransferase family 1 protein [Sphingomonas glacialis]
MRVGITVDPLSTNLTGIGRYTREIWQGLARHPVVDDLAFFLNDHWHSNPAGLLDGSVRRRSPLPKILRPWRAKSGFKGRLIHGTNYFLPPMAETGVITVHDLSIYLYPETHPVERIRDFEKQFARSLDRAAHVMTDSEATRRDLIAHLSYPADRVTTVHLGVSTRFHPASRGAPQKLRALLGRDIGAYVLSVATFEPRKRIEAAILAHAQFCSRAGRDVPLVLVGAKGWRNESLHALIEEEQRKGRLIMLGFVQEDDLPTLYAGARLFLYPSVYEGFGLPPIEAMACGVPTIVSNRSCLPEVTRGAAMTIDPDDIDSLSLAIERGLDDDIWRNAAIAAGITVAAHYSWACCVDKTVEVYRAYGAEVG